MLSEGLKLNSSLTVLDLRSCGIEFNGVPPIVEVLKSNTTLTAIDLSGNMLTHKGTTMIAEGLKLNSTLKQLALKKTSVGVEGATAILESLQSNTTLTKIALEDFNIAPLASKINSLLPPTAPPEKGEMSSGSIKLELNRSFNIETGRFGYGHLFFDGGEGGAITVEVRSNSTLLLVKDKDFENFLLKEMEQMNVEGQLIQLELEKCSTALLLVKSGDLVSKINISNEALSWKTFGYPKLELWELGKLKLL
uniref:Uncharacterized protein n=1 Tax=Arcella intermedia TaxID=1963864 RepID=A0A6B2LEI3_9EUKA